MSDSHHAEQLQRAYEEQLARANRSAAALGEARALIETAEQHGYVSAGWRLDARQWAKCWADA